MKKKVSAFVVRFSLIYIFFRLEKNHIPSPVAKNLFRFLPLFFPLMLELNLNIYIFPISYRTLYIISR